MLLHLLQCPCALSSSLLSCIFQESPRAPAGTMCIGAPGGPASLRTDTGNGVNSPVCIAHLGYKQTLHVSQEKPFYPGAKCNRLDIHARGDGTNPRKSHRISASSLSRDTAKFT